MEKDNYDKIIELRKEGKTVPYISKTLGIGKATVHKYLKRAYEDNLLEYFKLNGKIKLTEELKKKIKEKHTKTCNEKIMNEDFSKLSPDRIKKRIILEQNHKCNRCKLDKWLGCDIILELEHIDGNHLNNKRSNLESLCPNCHSLTATWRGRNKSKKSKVSDEALYNSLIENKLNIRKALISLGMVAKGGNYARCYNVLKKIKDNK